MSEPVWAFAQRAELVEALEWKTDVMRSRNAEQRVALRSAPRTMLQMENLLRGDELTAAHEILRYARTLRVPDWPRVARAGDVLAGLNVVVPVPPGMGLNAGDEALLWRSARQYEVVQVGAADAASVTLDEVDHDMAQARLMPLRMAFADEGLKVQRLPGDVAFGRVDFELAEVRDEAAGGWPQYRGHDVLTVCPKVGDGSLESGIDWPTERMDNGTGPVELLPTRSRPDERMQMRWHVFEREEAWALRQWLHSRKGRQRAFWFSTWGRDFKLAAPIGAADTSITVRGVPGLSVMRASFDIELRSKAGAVWRRQVSAPTPSGGNWVLPIGTALGVALQPAGVARVSLLRCVRFDADRIELMHRAGAGMAVAVPCVEVPIP